MPEVLLRNIAVEDKLGEIEDIDNVPPTLDEDIDIIVYQDNNPTARPTLLVSIVPECNHDYIYLSIEQLEYFTQKLKEKELERELLGGS